MATYSGTFACGHAGKIYRTGGGKANREKALWIIEHSDCPNCQETKRQAEIEEENENAKVATAELDLPQLQGSEKQVAWANTLRLTMLEYFDDLILGCDEERETPLYEREVIKIISRNIVKTAIYEVDKKQVSELLKDTKRYMLENETKASFWIDSRSLSIEVVEAVICKSQKELKETKIPNEILEEATVAPEKIYYPGIVKIKEEGDTIALDYMKNNDFRTIVKELGYTWNGCWQRKLTEKTGSHSDRMAELGNRLLHAGFSIQIFDDETREKAISGEFKTEHKRWIQRYSDTELGICFEYGDADVYKNAIKLAGAKYIKPLVVVDTSFVKEIDDFAQSYGFMYTEKAKNIIELCLEAWEKKERVVVGEREKTEESPNGLKKILEKTGAIIEDLIDEA